MAIIKSGVPKFQFPRSRVASTFSSSSWPDRVKLWSCVLQGQSYTLKRRTPGLKPCALAWTILLYSLWVGSWSPSPRLRSDPDKSWGRKSLPRSFSLLFYFLHCARSSSLQVLSLVETIWRLLILRWAMSCTHPVLEVLPLVPKDCRCPAWSVLPWWAAAEHFECIQITHVCLVLGLYQLRLLSWQDLPWRTPKEP